MKAEERRFILERAYDNWKMNTYVFDEADNLRDVYNRENPAWKKGDRPSSKSDMPVERMRFLETVRNKCSQKPCPRVISESDGIYYTAFMDQSNWLYVFGPFSVEDISFAGLIDYRKRHRIPNSKFKIPVLSLAKGINAIVLIYYMVTGNCVTEEEIFAANNLSVTTKVSSEEVMIYEISAENEEKRRLAYHDEMRWVAEIENGTRTETNKMFQAENLEKLKMIGTLSNKNAFKQYEYMVITSTCLACRAAIRGGVNVYDAYALADIFYQKVSMCSSVMELLRLYAEITDEFSSQVRKVKEHHSVDIVEQCKEYVARNRTKKFSLKELAKELEKNPSYLSRIFSEREDRTLQDYALSLRLEAGANLLKYSDKSVGEIAEYLNFSSQSYFGEYFKRQFGQSPAEYRRKNKIRDFKEQN